MYTQTTYKCALHSSLGWTTPSLSKEHKNTTAQIIESKMKTYRLRTGKYHFESIAWQPISHTLSYLINKKILS